MSVRITCGGVDRAIARMQGALDAIGGKRAGKIIANALNQSLAAGRKEAAKEARKAYTAPIKKLFDNIQVQRARGSSLHGELEFTSRKGVSLIHFKAQPNTPDKRPRAGVTAQARRKGPRRVWKKPGYTLPFVLKKKQGGYGIFVRKPDTKWGSNEVEMMFGPSPIQALQRRRSQEQIREKVEEAFEPCLTAEIDRALASLKGSSR